MIAWIRARSWPELALVGIVASLAVTELVYIVRAICGKG